MMNSLISSIGGEFPLLSFIGGEQRKDPGVSMDGDDILSGGGENADLDRARMNLNHKAQWASEYKNF